MADITGSITTGISLEGTLSVTSGSSGEIITGSTISGQIVGGPQGLAGADGADGADGLGWTGGSYDAGTGVVTFTSDDGLGFVTGDLRGADGADGADGAAGADGADGVGVPVGGTTGQVLAKATATDYDTEWVDAASGGGAVDSVNTQTGVVVLDADDIDDTSTAHKFVTASDLTTLSNTSGTNTGDQDLSTYQLKPSEGAFANGDKTKLDGIETGATADQTGAEIKAAYEAELNTNAYTDTEKTKLAGIEAAADVTDTANVTAAGALMDSEVTNLAQVKAFSSADYATAAQGALADSALQSGDVTAATIDAEASADGYVLTSDGAGNAAWEAVAGSGTVTSVAQTVPTGFTVSGSPITGSGTLAVAYDTGYQGYTTTEASKLSGIEASADVTDATNVAAAGAVMDGDFSTNGLMKRTGAGTYTSVTDNSSNWDTAYGWGNHASGGYAADSAVVHDTGDETVAGVKTFSSFPVTPSAAPTTDYQTANKKYVDDEITAAGGYNDEAAQDAVGGILTDSSEIDFTYNDATPSITASIVAGSIDETKLDTSVNASLDLADSATQPGDLATVATTGAYADLTGTPTIPTVSDTAYDATSWNGNLDAPTKNAVRDKIESMGSGSGDVTGPASSTDNAIARFDGTGGKTVQDSSWTLNDSGQLEYGSIGSAHVRISPSTIMWANGAGDTATLTDGGLSTSDSVESPWIIGDRVRADIEVQTDTISEQTAAAGVTIDGVLVKDGEVDGRDVSVDGTKLDGIEAGADVTDATNVAAAGAYMSGGTDVALADGGTGASLTDPNADRIMFWDDSAGAVTWLTASTGLTLSGTSLTARAASETVTGISERATTTEAATGTDTTRHVTPAGLTSFLSANIGSTVQAYDADLTSWAGKTAPTGDAVGTSDTQTLTNKTLTTPTIDQINNSSAPGVKLQVRTQTDNSDSISSATTAGVFVQYGWGQIVGNGTATISESVTFPTAFSTLLGVTVTPGAAKVGAATDITDIALSFNGVVVSTSWSSATTTGFTIDYNRTSGSFAGTAYYSYSWIAWGV